MIDPDKVPDTPIQAVCDIAYAAFAVWASLKVLRPSVANADLLLAWTKALPSIAGPAVAMIVSVLFFLLIMILPVLWAILWPRRFMPSSGATFAAFMIFNGFAYLIYTG